LHIISIINPVKTIIVRGLLNAATGFLGANVIHVTKAERSGHEVLLFPVDTIDNPRDGFKAPDDERERRLAGREGCGEGRPRISAHAETRYMKLEHPSSG
jgi:hypothetical protein